MDRDAAGIGANDASAQEFPTAPNVRAKVSSWVTGFVTEMRRKSPATVQKWVDSIPVTSTGEDQSISLTTSATSHDEPAGDELAADDDVPNKTNSGCDIVTDAIIRPIHSNTNIVHEEALHVEQLDVVSEEPELFADTEAVRSTNLWNSGPLLTKLNKSIDRLAEKASSESGSLTLLGKTKINEFYDKLSLNKKRFAQVKAKHRDIRRSMENIKEADTKQQHDASCDEPFASDDVFSSTPIDVLELDGSLDDKLMMECYSGESLSNSPRTSDDGGYLSGTHKFGSVSECPQRMKQKFLGNIGRSFSEHKPDDSDGGQAVLKERNSYPNTSISITDTSDNKMLAGFGGSSLPVSPSTRVPLCGGSRQSSRHKGMLVRDSSFQSDSSRCSSVESLLVARKPNPEEVLLNLGFGSSESEDVLSKIPKRFLRPSQVRGIDTEDFVRRQHVAMHLHEHSVLGYRGLVGNPHIAPSTIVAKIMERFQENDHNCYMGDNLLMSRPSSAPPTPGPTNPL